MPQEIMQIDEPENNGAPVGTTNGPKKFDYFELERSAVAKCLIDGKTYRFENGKWAEFSFPVEVEREKATPLSENDLRSAYPDALPALHQGIGSEKEMSGKEIRKRLFLLLYPDYLEREFESGIAKFSSADREKIHEAFNYAKQKHHGQYREENTPYYTHCLDTALNAIENGEGTDGVLVSLLHDTLEDTSATHEEITEKFGMAVAQSVLALSKVRDGKRISDEEYYKGLEEHPDTVKFKGYDRLSNVVSMHLAPEWPKRESYITGTNKNIIPMVKNADPALARKIELALDFVKENPSLTAEEQKKVADWKKVREMNAAMS